MRDPIMAITISQPFASLIAEGTKWVENRTWYTAYRGPLAIHAGRGTQYLSPLRLAAYPTGKVLAIADLVACESLEQLRQRSFLGRIEGSQLLTVRDVLDHEHTEGPWCWILQNVRQIEPVAWAGRQGLWTFDRSLAVTQGRSHDTSTGATATAATDTSGGSGHD